MPFDGTEIVTPAIRRRQLYDALCESLPARWKWNFGFIGSYKKGCGSAGCAIGLGYHLGILPEDLGFPQALGLDTRTAMEIFSCGSYACLDEDVTPAMVAARLKRHL